MPPLVGVMARRDREASVVYVHLRDFKHPYDGIPYPHNFLDMSLHLTGGRSRTPREGADREGEIGAEPNGLAPRPSSVRPRP